MSYEKEWNKLKRKMIRHIVKVGIPKDGLEFIETPFGILMIRKYPLFKKKLIIGRVKCG